MADDTRRGIKMTTAAARNLRVMPARAPVNQPPASVHKPQLHSVVVVKKDVDHHGR